MFHSRSRFATLVVAGLLVGGSPAFAQIPADLLARAEQGDAAAQVSLGVMYAFGTGGVPEDDAEAVRWYRLAAEQGLPVAQTNLGNMYASGEGVPEDDAEAVRWYRLAAEQGHARAQYLLGFMYATGEGVPENMERAYVWFSVAAAGQSSEDRDDAATSRDQFSKDFTPEQRARAEALATTCINSNFTDCGEPE